MQPLAQVYGSFEDTEAPDGRIQVQLVPHRAALEALVDMGLQVGGERTAAGVGGPMDRARAPQLVAGARLRDEADQLQNLSHGNERADLSEADAGHGGGPRLGTPRGGMRNREEEPVFGGTAGLPGGALGRTPCAYRSRPLT